MRLTKPIAFVDLEATGLDVAKDRIVQIAIHKISPATTGQAVIGGKLVDCFPAERGVDPGDTVDAYNLTEQTWSWLINPQMPIPPATTKYHGITDAMVQYACTFIQLAAEIDACLDGCDLAGFNLIHFDVPLLVEEFIRAGHPFNLDGRRIFDCGNIFKKMESRTLKAALAFYCGEELVDAHNARADAEATKRVFLGQMQRYRAQFIDMTPDEVAAFCRMDTRVDPAGKVLRGDDGRLVWGFGHHKDKPLADNIGLMIWFLRSDFPEASKRVVEAELDRVEGVQKATGGEP